MSWFSPMTFQRPWRRSCRYQTEVLALLLGFVAYFPGCGLSYLFLLHWGGDALSPAGIGWWAGLLGQIPALLTALTILGRDGPHFELRKKLGLRPLNGNALRAAGRGFLIIILGGNLLTFLWREILKAVDIPFSETQDLTMFAIELAPGRLLFLSLALILLVPAVEEIFFRRLLYRVLLPQGERKALLLGAAIFGGIHFFLLGFPMLMLMGIVLEREYIHTRNLLTPIIIHSAVNLTAVIGIFLQKYSEIG